MKGLVGIMVCATLCIAGIAATATTASAAAAKKAILVVSFGTSYADTRKATIEAVEQQVADNFPEYEMRRAFTSHIIMKILKERDGIAVQDTEQALTALKEEGFSEVIVQPLHVIPGEEFHSVVKTVNAFRGDFERLVIGQPLLATTDDLKIAAEALKTQIPELQENEAVVFMGHGTHHPANAIYCAQERMFEELEIANVLIGTVEGFPELDHVIKKLKKSNIDKVTLMPLMFVAGDHAQNDMAGDEEDSWKTILTNAGFSVDTYLHGLGENSAVQVIYLQHIKDAIQGDADADAHHG